ncbi:MAG: efflux RND transporter periplasmic adaptor subunit [Thermoguttaceae bacterium]
MYLNTQSKLLKELSLISMLVVLLLFSSVTGCKNGGPPKRPEMPPAVVVVDVSETRDVQLYIETHGLAKSSQEVDIPARVTGILEQIKFKPGDIVQEGQPLFVIEQTDYIATLKSVEAQLESNIASEILAKANLKRAKDLFDSQTISPEEYQTNLANYQQTVAAIKQAEAAIDKAKLNLSYTTINSPVLGKTGPNLVDIGNLVGPGSSNITLINVAKMDPLFVYFDISDADFNAMQARMYKERTKIYDSHNPTAEERKFDNPNTNSPQVLNVDVSPEGRGVGTRFLVSVLDNPKNGETPYPHEGTIELVNNTLEPLVGKITLRGILPNPDYMIFPEQTCWIRIPTEMLPGAVIVRETAINSNLNSKFVLLVDENNIVRSQDVKLGPLLDDGMRVILKGMKPGMRYIYEGVQKARVDSEVEPLTKEEYDEKMKINESEIKKLPPEGDTGSEPLNSPKNENSDLNTDQ